MRAGWRCTWPRNDSAREYTIFTGRPVCIASRHACTCRLTSSRAPNAPPTPPSDSRTRSGGEPEALRDLVAVVVQPLRRHDEVDAAVVGRDREPGLGPHERLVLHADLVGALDDDRPARVGVAAADHEVAEHVAVGVERRRVDRELGVDHRLEHLVVDDDRLARAPRGLGMVGRDRPRPARRRSARRRPTSTGWSRCSRPYRFTGTSSAVSTACTPGIASAGRDVDRADARRRVRRAQRAAPQHAVGPQVAARTRTRRAPSDAPSGRIARSPIPPATRVADVTLMRRRLRARGDRGLRPPRGCGRSRCSGTGCRRSPRAPRDRSGAGSRSSRSCTAITSPGVQKPHCTAPVVDERALHVAERAALVGLQAFDGDDLGADRRRREHEARAHQRAVDEHRARAALALLAARPSTPGSPSRSRSTYSRLSPSHASATGVLGAVHAQACTPRSCRRTARSAAAREHADRVPPVVRRCCGGRRSAAPPPATIVAELVDVVGGRRSTPSARHVARAAIHAHASGAASGVGPTDPSPTPTVRASRSTAIASDATAITIALRTPTFRYSCGPRRTGTRTATTSSPAPSTVRFGPTKNSRDRDDAGAARPGDLDRRAERDEHGQRVAGRRRGGEVAADRARVADLRRADGARRVRERRREVARPGRARARCRSTAAPITIASPSTRTPAQLGDPADGDHVRRATAGRRSPRP